MDSYIGAIDQGTTRYEDLWEPADFMRSTRFIVFNKQGEQISTYQMEHEQIYPHQGWVEHDPMIIIENVRVCYRFWSIWVQIIILCLDDEFDFSCSIDLHERGFEAC